MLDSTLSDFQKIVSGSSLAESRFKNKQITQEIPLANYDLFQPYADEINNFLEWLTDYDIKLKFTKSNSPTGRQQRLSERKFSYISLFSGGLDSGSLPFIKGYREKTGLLHHTHTSHRMLSIAKKLHKNFVDPKNKLVITKLNLESFIQTPIMHTRGMSFLTNLLCMAEEFNAQEVVIPENGTFMINHPISTLVSPTRTADPLMIERWSSIFFKIVGNNRRITFPFFNKTKSEVILMSEKPEIISNTWSCSTSQGNKKMCGICVACFFRMLSLYAINKGENISKCYNINPFLTDIGKLGSFNRHTFRVLLLFLDHWHNLLDPDSIKIEEERARIDYLINQYPILVTQAEDMFVALELCIKNFGNSHIVTKKAEQYLKMLDKSTIKNRSSSLEQQKLKYGWK